MAGGGVTLFKLGEHLDWLSLTLCMIGLIVFTIAFEVGLHNLEHRIKVRSIGWWLRTAVCMCRGQSLLLAHPGVPHTPLFVTVWLTGGRVYLQGTAWTKMLSKVYKELMILGFISFVLLMINQFINLPTTQLLMFELSHVWIFLVAVFFVVHAIIFMLLVRKVKRHWDATAHMEVPDLLQQYVARARTFGGVHGLASPTLTRVPRVPSPGTGTPRSGGCQACGMTYSDEASCERKWGSISLNPCSSVSTTCRQTLISQSTFAAL